MGAETTARLRGLVIALLILALAGAAMSCTAGPTLSRSYQDGKLSVSGSNFKPNEQVTVQLTSPGQVNSSLMLEADAKGEFHLDTQFEQSVADSVQVRAHGSQGSEAQNP